MNKTKVDDLLIEMIQPKITEIEKKFSSGEGLNQEDINTLLLKSQYNHINHLDQKLNEVTADVASLKGDFASLKADFTDLKGEFALLKSDIEATIQKALNKNMMLLITVMGIFVILFKLVDKI